MHRHPARTVLGLHLWNLLHQFVNGALIVLVDVVDILDVLELGLQHVVPERVDLLLEPLVRLAPLLRRRLLGIANEVAEFKPVVVAQADDVLQRDPSPVLLLQADIRHLRKFLLTGPDPDLVWRVEVEYTCQLRRRNPVFALPFPEEILFVKISHSQKFKVKMTQSK